MEIKLHNELKDTLVKVTIKYAGEIEKKVAIHEVELIVSKVLQQFENEFNELFEIETDKIINHQNKVKS